MNLSHYQLREVSSDLFNDVMLDGLLLFDYIVENYSIKKTYYVHTILDKYLTWSIGLQEGCRPAKVKIWVGHLGSTGVIAETTQGWHGLWLLADGAQCDIFSLGPKSLMAILSLNTMNRLWTPLCVYLVILSSVHCICLFLRVLFISMFTHNF